MRKSVAVLLLCVCLNLPLAGRAQDLPPCSVYTKFSGARSQMGRLTLDGTASTCPAKAYPGDTDPFVHLYYDTTIYPNRTGADVCVTVDVDPYTGNDPCGGNTHASAYLDTYHPASMQTNYLGDMGTAGTRTFAVEVPDGDDLVLVFTNMWYEEACTYSFRVRGLPCGVPPAPTVNLLLLPPAE